MIKNRFPTIMPTYGRFDVAFDHGEGPYLFDEAGKRYLDFCAGIAVSALGHAHPHLVDTLKAQAEKLWHTSNLYRIPGQEKLADRLVDATFADSVFFTNSGVEAVEAAIKLARKFQHDNGHGERYRIITFKNAFHGRSLATISAAKKDKLTHGFGPMVDAFDQVPFLDIEAARAAITPETAAILVEPVQGEGGILPASPDQLKALRALCDEHGLLLILDEIQCGMGRSGKLFAHEWAGIAPDVLCAAKGIGGGFPLGAVLATEAVAKAFSAGTHGTTYGGNPMAMAVGNAVMDVMMEEGFLDHVVSISKTLMTALKDLQAKYPDIIKDVRGLGLMMGVELTRPVRPVLEALLQDGMLAAASGENIIRLLPPLIISDEEVAEAINHLEKAIKG